MIAKNSYFHMHVYLAQPPHLYRIYIYIYMPRSSRGCPFSAPNQKTWFWILGAFLLLSLPGVCIGSIWLYTWILWVLTSLLMTIAGASTFEWYPIWYGISVGPTVFSNHPHPVCTLFSVLTWMSWLYFKKAAWGLQRQMGDAGVGSSGTS